MIRITAIGLRVHRAVIWVSWVVLVASCTAQSPSGNDDAAGFDAAAASKLTPERRAQLDVEFFNELDAKGEFGPDAPASTRVARVRAMAKEGFEVAYLADKLYAFAPYGHPTFKPHYVRYWQRLKELAATGDPSAQCLFARVVSDYRAFKQDPPTSNDEHVLAPQYVRAAAEKGHPHCLGLWSNKAFQYGSARHVELTRQCAHAGAVICQTRMAALYAKGNGVPEDRIKGLCWLDKARKASSALSNESWFRIYRGIASDQIGQEKLTQLLETVTPATDCDSFAEK